MELLKVAVLTEGLSGAELENIVNLAALQSVRKAVISKALEAKLTGPEFIEFATKHVQGSRQPNLYSMFGMMKANV